jgi:excisionase family DNA binding protein
MMTIEETARFLRMNRKSLYRLIDKKRLPGARRFGRVIRIHRPTLMKSFEVGEKPRW